VGPGKVAQYLATKGTPALLKGVGRLQKLKQNEQTHDDAGKKLNQSEKAVVIPPSEGQSKSNAGQVNTVDGRPKPIADESKAKGKLQVTLTENIPRTIEDVDNFQGDQKAQHMGADVMEVVQGDKNAVVSTFADMAHTPPPIPSDHKPETLPPEELAPSTAPMNLGQGAVAPLQKEHTDVSNYTKEADSKLTEEGVTQEQLDMVDSGDLAAANKEKKGMEKMATTEPLAIQKFAQQETDKVDKELSQEEKTERNGLKAKRKSNLGATAHNQKGAQSALEKKREEIAGKINGIYKAAQDKVKKKLAELETQSMAKFDKGNAKAAKDFEDNVNREFEAYKDKRYSGLGRLNKVRDWLRGMDDLPGVKAIFERNRALFVSTINKLVGEITADNKRVIQECKDELANAKSAIKDYVDQLEPGLKDIGKKAAGEMDAKLDDLDRFVAKKEQELQNKLKDKQTAAIKAIDEKIEKMKEAMSGALAKLGKLLLWAAKKFFTWALEKFGFSLADIEGIISKGVAVLKAIFTKPIQFVKNLINAASTGFKNFGKNFLKHLQDAVFEWLTGALEGVKLPESWGLEGVLSVIFQLLGITYQNIRSHLVKLIPEPVVQALETNFTLVKTLITAGPLAAWEQLKDIAGEIKDAFTNAVKDWIKRKVVEEAIKTVLAMFIPGAGIIRAIIGVYDTIIFFIQKAKQIMQMIGSFLGSIAEIAAGNIGAAATALEDGLARGLKLVIEFLAKFLRLTGIRNKIKAVIQNIRGKVDAVIEKVATWVVGKAGNLASRALGGNPNASSSERVANALREAVPIVNRFAGRFIGARILRPLLAPLRVRHRLTSIDVVARGDIWLVDAAASPGVTAPTAAKVEGGAAAPGQGTGSTTTNASDQLNVQQRELDNLTTGMLLILQTPLGEVEARFEKKEIYRSEWRIFYYSASDRASPNVRETRRGSLRGLSSIAAYNTAGQRNFRRAGLSEDIVPEVQKELRNGKPVSVYTRPLILVDTYQGPGSANPVGWSRIRSESKRSTDGTSADLLWVRGHLINGILGGPGGRGSEWNLVPITGANNAEMRDAHEEILRTGVARGRYYWFRATVFYHANTEHNEIGNYSDFAKGIVIRIGEVRRVGNTYVPAGGEKSWSYTIRKIETIEIIPLRLRS